jgi:hypothetical protein
MCSLHSGRPQRRFTDRGGSSAERLFGLTLDQNKEFVGAPLFRFTASTLQRFNA